MVRKRNVRTRVLLMLRQLGMLCKKPVEYKHPQKPRIQHTVYPEGYVNPFDSQRHVWLMNKKSGIRNCEFDLVTKTCSACNLDVDAFANGDCHKRKIKIK